MKVPAAEILANRVKSVVVQKDKPDLEYILYESTVRINLGL